jgi:CDP-glycerol glycerophosphotransferase
MSSVRVGRLPGIRQVPPLLQRVDDGAVLFESWLGGYSDNPRAISEAFERRGEPYERIWATPEAGCAPHSRRYLEALGRARYVVTNLAMPRYYRKKSGTTYVQTWHGTPLKRIGFDIERPAFAERRRFEEDLRRDVAKWDVLISPNSFSTEVFRQAFRYDGTIVESGYPRNDILRSPDAVRVGAAVRRELQVPAEARVVLYAPTWRDDDAFDLKLDVHALTRELPDTHLLLRAHKRVADTVEDVSGERVRNVSRYPDVRDLLLAADVLVTDYSSAMFDFAVTGKPMLFFTYDLAAYRDEIRGFYFDFEREAPGPLVATSAELIEALAGLDDVTRQYRDAYARFATRFCALEDGHAADRVIDAVFTP